MDVLAYSAVNQQIQLNQQIVEKTSCLSTKCSETLSTLAEAAQFGPQGLCWVQCIEPCLLREPFRTSFYDCIPDLEGASDGFKVCDTAAQFNCGACCAWTVPAGVTRARFQLWGAGGGANKGPCCCGDAPFGSTGAYASVIIPVTEGCTYTLCSGCAFCCFASSTSGAQRIPGCPSWVTGSGLCNFCANGGQGSLGNWMAALGRSSPCQVSAVNFTACGARICNSGGDLCGAGSCSNTGAIIQHVPGAAYFGTTTSESFPSIVYGIRGMWPCYCATANNYGCQKHAPIYGFVSTSQCNPGYSSGTCCGFVCRAAAGFLQIPGAGGFYSHAMAGSNTLCGDMGRMGMVCVSFL
jgi:hypothetical protein